MILFERGKGPIWDGTVVNILAPSYVNAGSQTPNTAVARAETLKEHKYSDLAAEYFFSPLAFETLARPGPLTRIS